MENIISDTVSTVKNYLTTVRIFFKGRVGFYFIIFKQDVKNSEGRKYFTLFSSIFVFAFFIATGRDSGAMITLDPGSVYENAMKSIVAIDLYKSLLRGTLVFVLVLELLAYILGRSRSERKFLSIFNFVTASWFILILLVFMLGYILTAAVGRFLSISESVLNGIVGLIGLVGIPYLIYIYFAPYRALNLAVTKKYVVRGTPLKGILLQLGMPVLFFLMLKGSIREFRFDDPPKIDSVLFLDGTRNAISIQIDSLGINVFKVRSAFVLVNGHERNYIVDPGKRSFLLRWDQRSKTVISPENAKYSDSIDLSDMNNTKPYSISRNTPEYVNLEAVVDSVKVLKLLVLRSCTNGRGSLVLNTIDSMRIQLDSGVIQFKYRTELASPHSCTFVEDRVP